MRKKEEEGGPTNTSSGINGEPPPDAQAGPCQSALKVKGVPKSKTLVVDWDELYEEGGGVGEAEDGDPAGRTSVLSYLWSQMKIGMDLTKITLPTYILERRSLLEMYADFFAHPDLFVAIADAPTPKLRFIAVVKWYLTSFHASRKSDVAKKPYNPILGEVFTCVWKEASTPAANDNDNDTTVQNTSTPEAAATSTATKGHDANTNDSPAAAEISSTSIPKFKRELISESNAGFFDDQASFQPWLYNSPDTLLFYGEQVSHHPPVSAFYAEHPGKRIYLNAHIWTKSKFLGLSVSVQNVGSASIVVLGTPTKKEEYTLTFPTGYGRSILSVPWIELGGPVEILGVTTGYRAEVEFCTKTFFGRDRNRVIAKLYAPSSKNPFLCVDGTWNDSFTSTGGDEGSRGRGAGAGAGPSVFADLKSIPTAKKQCRKVMEQEEFESRRLWRDVTKALKYGEVEEASNAKQCLESRQRAEEREREEGKRAPWSPRMFTKKGDKWHFIQKLDQR